MLHIYRNLTLTFRPDESILQFTVSIFNDIIPEVDESFVVDLSMPTGGARVGPSSSTAMTILTNDDAHGLVGFADDSLSVIISEMEINFVVTLQVERTAGTFGLVIVDWELSGSHMVGEITPASGQVQTFPICSSIFLYVCEIFASIPSLGYFCRWCFNGHHYSPDHS